MNAHKLNLNKTSTRGMLESIGGYPYCIQIGQRLNIADNSMNEDHDSLKPWFSVESHLNDSINTKANRFLGVKRSDVIVWKPLHGAQVTFWITVSGRGKISPYFIEDANKIQERYRRNIIVPCVRTKCRFANRGFNRFLALETK